MAVNLEHLGSTLDELLAAENTLTEVTQIAEERVRAYLSTRSAGAEPVNQPSDEQKVR